MNSLTAAELDQVYTRLCKTMTGLGEANVPLYLARFALLAITRMDDAEAALRLVEAAVEGITPTPSAPAAD